MKRALLGAAAGVSLGAALAVETTLRVPIFDFRSAASSPWLLSSVPRLLPTTVAVVLGGVLGALLGRRGREDLLTPFLPGGLAASVFFPGVFAVAPFLASFSGWSLGLLLAAALAISISRLGGKLPARVSAKAVFLAGLVTCLGVGSWISSRVGLSGDEPHYLLTTYSLLHARDLAVQNNYGAEDSRSFYAGKIEPRLAPGTSYSVHGIGLPLLLAPGFAAFGLGGVLATEALLSALLLAALYRASLAITASAPASLAATAGFGLTSPALFLTVSAYPELPAALLAALVARKLCDSAPRSSLAVSGLSLALGTLPFFHVKFLPLGAVLVGALAWRFGRAVWPAAISLGSFFLVTFLMFGTLDPTASYGRPRLFLEGIPAGIAGLLFDQEYGLLLHAPFYLVGFAGLVTLVRRSPLAGVVSIFALLAVLIPGAAHPLWSGGTSPPARFLFPALPFLALGAAALLAREREIGAGRWAPWLLAWSVALGLAMLFLPRGPFFLNTRDGTGRVWEALSTSWNLSDYLPSLIEGDPRSLASAGALFLLLAVSIGAQLGRTRGFPISMLFGALLLGAFFHDTTGVTRSRELEPHWVSRVMHRLSKGGAEVRYVALPSFERLSQEDILARVSLPLEAVSDDGDPRHWWSRAYSLPAGRFRLTGTPPLGITFYNGEGAFQFDGPVLETGVALERFRLRARNLFEPPRLFLLEPRRGSVVALATLAAGGLRLHALDDEVYT
ncbi:MAG TPA: hypothetical protein VJ921_11620, partial [Vicinamibacteria bacterium]|nr:hypothetical protein [Vicinamibacteria bacterium]